MKFSIIIPAKNEEQGLAAMLPSLREEYPEAEIIVVNDGSTDRTAQVCEEAGVAVLTQPYSKGNGAAIKAGARAATGDYGIQQTAHRLGGSISHEDGVEHAANLIDGYLKNPAALMRFNP